MSIITLTTDFGTADHYVGAMKGVILGRAPSATVVDITHEIPPQDVRRAALVLANVVGCFSPGTVHVTVVDPGVGSTRRILAAEYERQVVLAPDNGLLTPLVQGGDVRLRSVTASRYFRTPVSQTFHGRDVFAPVAAHLAMGLPPAELGPMVDDPVTLPWPEPRIESGRILGEVLYVDRFGNLVTNIRGSAVRALGPASAHIGAHLAPVVSTYADASAGSPIALIGSSDVLEISVVMGHAARALGVGVGAAVTLSVLPR
jgi:S-adenosylmethionine hydrolase